jgi:aspartate carbamoyltransferase catalytic subunit
MKGIKLKYSNMIKLKKFSHCTIVDSIDQSRVNHSYFQILKNLNMFNRFRSLESWLLEKEWKKDVVKKVKHKHFTNHRYFNIGKT